MISPAACQLGMCAHPKIDPTSGEMIVFRYWMDKSYLYWAAVGPDGTVTRPPEVIAEIDRGYLIHDFVITHDFLWCHTHDTNGGDKGGIGERWLSVLQAPRQSGALCGRLLLNSREKRRHGQHCDADPRQSGAQKVGSGAYRRIADLGRRDRASVRADDRYAMADLVARRRR
jgi:hypothetical protein